MFQHSEHLRALAKAARALAAAADAAAAKTVPVEAALASAPPSAVAGDIFAALVAKAVAAELAACTASARTVRLHMRALRTRTEPSQETTDGADAADAG